MHLIQQSKKVKNIQKELKQNSILCDSVSLFSSARRQTTTRKIFKTKNKNYYWKWTEFRYKTQNMCGNNF